jgi:V/A-type H+-transporting ATPase subunit I
LAIFVGLPLGALWLKEPVRHLRRAGHGHGDTHRESLAMVVVESCIETFETVLGYVANTVSFVRLSAYAMSHAAILMATFLMAHAAGAAGGVLGFTGKLAIVAAGNAVAIMLEGVVASVQTLRLEYYEFFSKFYAGDGRAFDPFSLPTMEG